jgi:alpha-L-fucosidase
MHRSWTFSLAMLMLGLAAAVEAVEPAGKPAPMSSGGGGDEWQSPPTSVPRDISPPPGPFAPEWSSLEKYQVPDWYRDAKFGIFVHWGPQTLAGPRGSSDGTKSPRKELARAFRGEKFDADHWAAMFKLAGAKYVVQVAEHHDGYALYDSSYTCWSSVRMQPRRDFVAELAAAVRKQGLVFGASSHTEEHYWFYSEPPKRTPPAPLPGRPIGEQPSKEFLDWWYARLVEIVDKYQPQIFWFDWCIEQPAYEPYLRKFAAYYYNRGAKWKQGVVLNYKYNAFPDRAAVRDISWNTGRISWRPEAICPTVWQFDTMSNRKYWFWRADMEMRPLAEVLAEMVDVVSKNGNYLLNFPPAPDGSLTPEQEKLLRGIGQWLSVNGEAIYGTRPRKVFGEGPTEGLGTKFQGNPPKSPYTSKDIRFTTKGPALYAIVLAWPENGKVTIPSLASREIKSVSLLGSNEPVGRDGLTFEFPSLERHDGPVVLKIQ